MMTREVVRDGKVGGLSRKSLKKKKIKIEALRFATPGSWPRLAGETRYLASACDESRGGEGEEKLTI